MIGSVFAAPFRPRAYAWPALSCVWRVCLAALVAGLGGSGASSSAKLCAVSAAALLVVWQLLHALLQPGRLNRTLAACYAVLQLLCALTICAATLSATLAGSIAAYVLLVVAVAAASAWLSAALLLALFAACGRVLRPRRRGASKVREAPS